MTRHPRMGVEQPKLWEQVWEQNRAEWGLTPSSTEAVSCRKTKQTTCRTSFCHTYEAEGRVFESPRAHQFSWEKRSLGGAAEAEADVTVSRHGT